jgi:hypothetical protein
MHRIATFTHDNLKGLISIAIGRILLVWYGRRTLSRSLASLISGIFGSPREQGLKILSKKEQKLRFRLQRYIPKLMQTNLQNDVLEISVSEHLCFLA